MPNYFEQRLRGGPAFEPGAGDPGAKSGIPWGPIGSIAGTIVDAWSQGQANKSNAANVDKQIAFQKEQSETQYQRAVADMIKAGLNPALGYSQGGNQNQSGAAAQVQPTMRDTGDKIANALQIANIAKQGNLLDQQASSAGQQARAIQLDNIIKSPDAAWAQKALTGELYGNVRNLELGRRGDEASNYRERYAADLARTKAGTTQANAAATAAEAQAALSGSVRRLNEQEYLPDVLMGKPIQWANATARGMSIAGQATGLFSGVRNLQLQKKRLGEDPRKQDYDQEENWDPESNMKFTRRKYK